MRKVKFKLQCKDKYTGRVYERGDIVEFGDERAEEILAVDGGKYAKGVMEPKREKDEE